MTLDQVRNLLRKRIAPYRGKRGIGLRPWCAAQGVNVSHASEFLDGRRLPTTDLLNALDLEWRVMRKPRRAQSEDARKKGE